MENKNNLNKSVVYYSAWGVVIGVLLVFVSILAGGSGILQMQSLANPLIYALVLLRTVNLVYPIAILRLAVKEKNYSFLQSPLHYIALPLCLLMWIGLFL